VATADVRYLGDSAWLFPAVLVAVALS